MSIDSYCVILVSAKLNESPVAIDSPNILNFVAKFIVELSGNHSDTKVYPFISDEFNARLLVNYCSELNGGHFVDGERHTLLNTQGLIISIKIITMGLHDYIDIEHMLIALMIKCGAGICDLNKK
jgi:hypothetical protein